MENDVSINVNESINTFRIKGSVDNVSDLEKINKKMIGDIYYIKHTTL